MKKSNLVEEKKKKSKDKKNSSRSRPGLLVHSQRNESIQVLTRPIPPSRNMTTNTQTRCSWAECKNDSMKAVLLRDYHDTEWAAGSPYDLSDDYYLQLLTLEAAQAGLSWSTVLVKREQYLLAFDRFDLAKVVQYGPADVERLLDESMGIIRNRLKIEASIHNARSFAQLIAEEEKKKNGSRSSAIVKESDDNNNRGDKKGVKKKTKAGIDSKTALGLIEGIDASQSRYFAGYLGRYFPNGEPIVRCGKERITTNEQATLISEDLKKRGFKFVGPTIMYALLQSVGFINDHEKECFLAVDS